jgi:integrase
MRIYKKVEEGPWYMEGQVAGHRFNSSTGLRDQGEAEQFMLRHAEKLRLKSVGIVVEVPPPVVAPTLHRICETWSGLNVNNHSMGHLRNVSDHVRLHLDSIAHLPVSEITPMMWEQCKNKFLLDHARSSYNGIVRSYNLLMHWALEVKLITEIPFIVSKIRVKKRARKVVHFHDFARLAEICDRHPNPVVGGLVRLIMGTGVRLTEALAARWEYFDEHSRTYVPQGYEPEDGTKGGEAEHMAMPNWLYEFLMTLPRECEYIFPNRNGQPFSVSLLKKPLKAAAAELGLPRLYAHLLRVSFASGLLAEGIDIRTVQEALRHANSSTTEGYCEVLRPSQQRAKAVLDGPAVPLPHPRGPKRA